MRRLLTLVVVLTALAATGPLAEARVFLQGESPVAFGAPGNPQFYCVVVFDAPGTQMCKVTGRVRGVDMVRIRIAGPADVHVSVIDEAGPIGLPEQRAVVDCSRTCDVPIPYGPHSDDKWSMWVWASSPGPAAAIEASLEMRAVITRGVEA